MATKIFEERLRELRYDFHPVVPIEKNQRLLLLDFTENNKELTPDILNNTNRFIKYINSKLGAASTQYGIGGYNEDRTIYSRSELFGGPSRRSWHLGIDIWGKPYTRVMAPLNGIVHSFAFNNAYGDYGTTIILSHQLNGFTFHTLYGHLSLNSITNIQEGDVIRKGDVFAAFGIPYENGHWPPHLHFQIIIDMEGMKGDYPGVCSYNESEKYLDNCPDPDIILNMMQYANAEANRFL